MDEIGTLRDSFVPETPSTETMASARAALERRIATAVPRRGLQPGVRRRTPWVPFTVGVVAAGALVVAIGVSVTGHPAGTSGGGTQAAPVRSGTPGSAPPAVAAAPYLRPVSAAQYLENAAWSAERRAWTDPTPQQFMFIQTVELSNTPAYRDAHPNGALVPGKTSNRTVQEWNRVDGQVKARRADGEYTVTKLGDDHGYWQREPWSTIAGLTTPEKVKSWVDHPGNVTYDPTAFIGQYVLPPAVQAAFFRYLASLPGMKVNPDAVNIDGRPAIGLGQVVDGYLSQELMFDKETYALVGDRLIAVADHTGHALDGTTVIHKGDLFRQVVYQKMIIVDRAGDTD